MNSSEVSTGETTEQELVYPFCKATAHQKYFENFSLFLMIYFIILFNLGISFCIFSHFIYGCLTITYSLVAFVWLVYNLSVFKNKSIFGGRSSYLFSLLLLISNLIKILIFSCLVTDSIIAEMHHIFYFKNIDPQTYFIIIFGFFTPFLGYMLYLCILYFFVVYKENRRICDFTATSIENINLISEDKEGLIFHN